MKPIAERISQWGSATEIIYKCPRCDCSFAFYSSREKFCHYCGIKIEWDNIPLYCTKEFSESYHKATYSEQKEMIRRINIVIQRRKDDDVKCLNT